MVLSHKGILIIIAILLLLFLFLSPMSAEIPMFGNQDISDEKLLDRQLELGDAVNIGMRYNRARRTGSR
jgi:hypothetical protein